LDCGGGAPCIRTPITNNDRAEKTEASKTFLAFLVTLMIRISPLFSVSLPLRFRVISRKRFRTSGNPDGSRENKKLQKKTTVQIASGGGFHER
jgi:hypothetical protein